MSDKDGNVPSGLEGSMKKYEEKREERERLRLQGETRGSKVRSGTEKLLTRTLSGLFYSVIVLVCIFWGPLPCAVLFCAMAWLCCSEFFRMARMLGRMPNELVGLTAAVAFVACPLLPDTAAAAIFSLLVLACGVWFVWTARASISDVAITVFGPVYTGFLLSFMMRIRLMEAPGQAGEGPMAMAALLTFGVIASIWMSDAAAYFVGSRFGRHKMVPKISPHKTWEGFVGGMAGSIFVWVLMWLVGLPCVTLPLAVLGGVGVGALGVVGDLFESRLKRAAGVKDSGNFIPGHGGMLDRTDSILFGSMTAYFILRLGGLL
ncbi:phosphatidate cytidylyltransferase [Atopobiaceae bacterium 24-176]